MESAPIMLDEFIVKLIVEKLFQIERPKWNGKDLFRIHTSEKIKSSSSTTTINTTVTATTCNITTTTTYSTTTTCTTITTTATAYFID